MKSSKRTYILISAITLLVSIVLFQNCAPGKGPSAISQEKAIESSGTRGSNVNPLEHLANGDGYAKGIYLNVASKTSSCPDGVQAVIKKDGNSFTQSVKDCLPLNPPLDISSSIDTMEHNPLVLFSSDILYEIQAVAQAAPSEILCRGIASEPYKSKLPYADISLLPTGKKTASGKRLLSGYIIMGNYAGGSLSDRETVRLTNVTEDVSADGIYSYVLAGNPNDSDLAPHGLEVYKAKGAMEFEDKASGQKLLVANLNCHGHTPATLPSLGGTSVTTSSTASQTKCTFKLRGELGYEWTVERYVAEGQSCDAAKAEVIKNNPKATIVDNSANYVYDPIGDKPKIKCTFNLTGENGYKWTVERYIAAGGNCSSELPTVKANNPKATISLASSTQVNTVVTTTSKVVCTFTLKGEKGYVWTVERQLPAGGSCSSERATVQANNPKATITGMTQKTVTTSK